MIHVFILRLFPDFRLMLSFCSSRLYSNAFVTSAEQFGLLGLMAPWPEATCLSHRDPLMFMSLHSHGIHMGSVNLARVKKTIYTFIWSGKTSFPNVQINVICYAKFCMYEWCAKWQGCCVILIPPLNYSPDIQMLRLSKIMQDVCMKWTQLNSAIYGLTPRIPHDWWCAGNNGLTLSFTRQYIIRT